MEQKEKTVSVFILLIVIVAVAAVYFWGNEIVNLFYSAPASVVLPVEPAAPIAKPAEGLGSDIVSQVENPVEGNIPETNPFSAPINPFENVYKNPFSQ